MINPPKHSSGFSLTELLIVLTIIVIIVLIAIPNYQHAILKTLRAEARSALYSVMLQQERFYTQHNTYSAFSSATLHTPFKWWSGDSIASSFYEISANPCPGKLLNQCVLLTATANPKKGPRMIDPVCGDLMLDSTHNKTSSRSRDHGSECW